MSTNVYIDWFIYYLGVCVNLFACKKVEMDRLGKSMQCVDGSRMTTTHQPSFADGCRKGASFQKTIGEVLGLHLFSTAFISKICSPRN